MAEFTLSTVLDAPVEDVWGLLLQPESLIYVSHGLMGFRPIDPPSLPARWSPGPYVVQLRAFGRIPLGRQTLGVEFPEAEPGQRCLRDNGSGTLVRRWDHVITLAPASDETSHYTDAVRMDAGLLTRPITLWARMFYAHRQRRWAHLIARESRTP